MPKINQEEYEVLKDLDSKWKWIARNYNGALITYTDKPMKNPNLYWDSFGERMDDRLFQFIQWEDEEPYEIAELIEEYESDEAYKIINRQFESLYGESEETEMKDIEWLKEETNKILRDKVTDGINYYDYMALKSAVDELINQLDEPETLSQERIDKNAYQVIEYPEMVVPSKKLKNLLVPKQEEVTDEELESFLADRGWWDEPTEEQVIAHAVETREIDYNGVTYEVIDTKSDWEISDYIMRIENAGYVIIEKPVIPAFLAKWIEDYKEREDIYTAISNAFEGVESTEMYNWVSGYTGVANQETFARAWLDGYKIEEEQKYYVINNDHRMMLVRMMDGNTITEADPFPFGELYDGEKKSHRLTEQEIKDYDERYWPFAVKVEEMEE